MSYFNFEYKLKPVKFTGFYFSFLNMQDFVIDLILKINKRFFFKKSHPFNQEKDWVLNLNYSDFEYNNTWNVLDMYFQIMNFCSKKEKDDFFKGKKILEVWCGGWWKSVYIAEKYGSKVVWLDTNTNFLNQANSFSKEKNLEESVKFVNESAICTWFRDEEFDIIIMSDVIEHIPDTYNLFKESFRILKKGWFVFFDFASYYHYFWHHIWDSVQIPWLHIFFTEKFLIRLYKRSLEGFSDAEKRINLRIWKKWGLESFVYLNKIKRKDFENVVSRIISEKYACSHNINFYMLKNLDFLSKVPFLREVFIRHIVWYFRK